jgi:LPS-assembly lipoprotein
MLLRRAAPPPFAIILIAGILSACGFHPLYGDAGANSGRDAGRILASVRVAQIAEREGQEMTTRLRDTFNPSALTIPEAYRLNVALNRRIYDQLTRSDNTAARTNTLLSATWSLVRIADGKTVLSGTSRSLNSHDVLDNDYANLVSTQSDRDRAVQAVSDDIEWRVAAWAQANH